MGGRSSRKANQTDAAAAAAQQEQTRMARELFNQSAPARNSLFAQGQSFLDGNFDVTSSPVFGAGKSAIEDQFNMAQNSVIGNMPEGGGLSSALQGLEGQRARGFGDLTSSIATDEMNRITGLATGGAVQGSNTMSSAAGVAAQRAQAAAQDSAGKSSGAGQAAGGAAALGSAALKSK